MNEEETMKTNDIITAAELTSLIEKHGAGTVSIDGSMPEQFANAAELGLGGSDEFRVVINYGHPVQFHLISREMRAIVTTGLTGRCDAVEGWVAAQ